jgi:uncharacterized membrane protein YgcG
MTYKSFIMTLPDDLEPGKFQSLYEDYQGQYLTDFSNAFFHISKTEEWFQERYNPLKMKERDNSNAQWATSESALFRDQLLENAGKVVHGVRLGPNKPAKASDSNAIGTDGTNGGTGEAAESGGVVAEMASGDVAESGDTAAGGDEKEEEGEGEGEGDGEGEAMVEDEGEPKIFVPKSSRGVKGHDQSCVFVAGVHACCTKAIFKSSVNEAMTNTGVALPERILVGQPVWVGRPNRFEKCAWIIFPSHNDARKGLKILRDMRFGVPGKMDREKGEATLLFTFGVDAAILKPPKNQFADDYCSRAPRVTADEEAAVELASLLDREREVPEDSSIDFILSQPAVNEALEEPTDKLDLAIAYLRRVHFVAFYLGKRFLDEAHMLAIAPSVTRRNTPYMTVEEEEVEKQQALTVQQQARDAMEQEQAQQAQAPSDSGAKSKRKRASDDMEDGDGDGGEGGDEITRSEKEALDDEDEDNVDAEEAGAAKVESQEEGDKEAGGEGDAMAVEGAAVAAPAKAGASNRLLAKLGHKVYQLKDRRISSLIKDLKEGRNYTEAKEKTEAAAEELSERQDATMVRMIEASCKVENEGKARCCFPACNKLFRGIDFLKKHMKAKHELFALNELTADAEPYMKTRYDEQLITARPLPPIEVETVAGIEQRGVSDMMVMLQKAGVLDKKGKARGGGGGRGGGGRGGDRRGGGGGRGGGWRPEGTFVQPRSEDNQNRKLKSYLDIDAPTESVINIDYGVAALPPPVKRRKVVKK